MNGRVLVLTFSLLSVCYLAGCESRRVFRCSHSCRSSSSDGSIIILGDPTVSNGGSWNHAQLKPPCALNGSCGGALTPPSTTPGILALPSISNRNDSVVGPSIGGQDASNSREQTGAGPKDPVIMLPGTTNQTGKGFQPATPDLLDALNKMSGKIDPSEQIVSMPTGEFRLGQADNYKQVTGQVQQWRKAWRLRYASVDTEDAYGGSLVLEGVTDPSKLRDGRHVRVRGVLVPPDTRQDQARYIVQGIEILD